jgi:putative phosphoribosyl transferase
MTFGEISQPVQILSRSTTLEGILSVPEDPRGLVLFAHGSGSSRLSPRNAYVAAMLNQAGFVTLLLDLLTPEEAENRRNLFDIQLMAGRLTDASRWTQNEQELRHLPLGYFGASTGAAAALWAAAELGIDVQAVVSRGGRPDLAKTRLEDVAAPTLLIVGSEDTTVIRMNESALQVLPMGELNIVPGATHLFEEPGALESVAEQAKDWFLRFMRFRERSPGETAA